MRNLFPDFYERDGAGWDLLWKEATFVLDANVLLRLSVLPPNSQQELFEVLESLQAQIWVPHQAALEYQRGRSTKLRNAVTEWKTHCSSVSDGLKSATEAIGKLELEQWNLVDEKAEIDEHIQAFQFAVDALNEKLAEKFEAAADDTQVRKRLDRLLHERIGKGPVNEADMQALIQDGAARYTAETPPGFNDAGKAKEKEPTFRHNGLTYERQYGDLILWRQLLDHAKTSKLKHLIFVTEDRKPDWWKKDGREIVGLHPDLVHEARTIGGIQDFHMYTLPQFLTRAKGQLQVNVSDETIQEIEASSKSSTPLLAQNLQRTVKPRSGFTAFGERFLREPTTWAHMLDSSLDMLFGSVTPLGGLRNLFGEDAPEYQSKQKNGSVIVIKIMDLSVYPVSKWQQEISEKVQWLLHIHRDSQLAFVFPTMVKATYMLVLETARRAFSELLPQNRVLVKGYILELDEEGDVLELDII